MLHVVPAGILSFPSGYTIENAIMLDGGADYLVRDPFTAGNRRTFTFSCWLKRSAIGSQGGTTGNNIFGGDRTSSFSDRIMFGSADDGNDQLETSYHDGSSGLVKTSALYRDPTAWMNVVWVVDTTQSTDTNRVKVYVNGSLVTFNSPSYPTQNYDTNINFTENQVIGARPGNLSHQHFGGYMAEVILLDGTAESDASKFGELDSKGVWVPVEPTGLSFGTNGFHLKFDDTNLLGKSSNSTTNPTVSFLGSHVDAVDRQEYTVPNATLGTAASNRSIVVAVGGARANAGVRTITSLTVGGTAATEIARSFQGNNDCLYFFIVEKASDTTGNIVATFSGGNNQMAAVGFAWWRVLDAGQPISIGTATGSSWSTLGTSTIGQTGDVALYALFDAAGVPAAGSNAPTGYSWSDATERAEHLNISSGPTDGNPGTHHNFVAADYTFTSAENHTETVTIGDGEGNETSYAAITLSNNNSFTTNSLAAANQVTDTCTDNAETIGNYCTWNPLASSPNNTFSEGNLRCAMPSSGATQTVRGSFVIQSGKWHWEATLNSGSGSWIGVLQGTNSASNIINYSGDTLPGEVGVSMTYCDDGQIYNDNGGGAGGSGISSTAPATYSAGDRITVELNADDNEIQFFKNGSSQVTITSGLAPPYMPTMFRGSNPNITINFGQKTFTDTPSSGFKALNTANLPAPTVTKPSDHYKTITYEGAVVDSSSRHTASGVTSNGTNVSSFNASQLIDNNSSTAGIRVDGTGGELSFDLGSAKVVGAVGIFMDNGGGNNQACTWSVLYSDNNSDFTDTSQDVTYSDGGESSSTEVIKTFSGSHGTHRYWKLRVESRNGSETATSGKIYGINLYSANAREITGVEFQPDFVWIKCRSHDSSHMLFDSVRGATKFLQTNSNGADDTNSETLTAFNTDGFTLGSNNSLNVSSRTYVAWCWKDGGAPTADNSAGQTPTNNSVFRNGSASTTAFASANIYPTRASIGTGISILKYTGNNSSNQTLATGLTGAADFAIIKRHTSGGDWAAVGIVGSTIYGMELNNPTAESSVTDQVTAFGNGTITINGGSANDPADYSAFIFQKTSGLIGVGTYSGNNDPDGSYVVIDDGASGFRPAWLLMKNINDSENWVLMDSARSPFNAVDGYLSPNTDVGDGSATGLPLDFTANGFKQRNNSNMTNEDTIIYLAFAEHPFGGNGVAQARAR